MLAAVIAPLLMAAPFAGHFAPLPLAPSLASAPALAQAPALAPAPPSGIAADRLTLCREEARRDPATAIVTASQWLAESHGAGRSAPQQCLGFAYTSLLRWEAAESAFLAARAALLDAEHLGRARLAAMAGNAALADGRFEAALAAFDLADGDIAASSDEGEAGDGRAGAALRGELDADRARALVALGRLDAAGAALARARAASPQSPAIWLLSATLSRRQDNLVDAQAQIETAAALAPATPASITVEIGLEAGLIAALAGHDEAARRSWRSVIDADPGSSAAAAAQSYLAQLDIQETPQ